MNNVPPGNSGELTKKCSRCAETIKLEATKCRYCGTEFNPEDVERMVAAAEAGRRSQTQMPIGPARTNGLAIASLVLGFMFCLLGPLAAIPAIICGHLALSRIHRSGGTETGDGMAVAGLVLGYIGGALSLLFLPILAAIFLPALSRAHEAANRATCQNNLKQLEICIKMFEGEHRGEYPQRMADLYPEYLTDPNILICPSSGHKPGDSASMDEWMDYQYFPQPPNAEDSETVVFQDKDTFHIPSGRNVAFADGHVEFRRE